VLESGAVNRAGTVGMRPCHLPAGPCHGHS